MHIICIFSIHFSLSVQTGSLLSVVYITGNKHCQWQTEAVKQMYVCVCSIFIYLGMQKLHKKYTSHKLVYILWQEEDFCHFFILHFHLYNRHLVQFHVGYSNIKVFYTLNINFLCLYIHIKLMKNT